MIKVFLIIHTHDRLLWINPTSKCISFLPFLFFRSFHDLGENVCISKNRNFLSTEFCGVRTLKETATKIKRQTECRTCIVKNKVPVLVRELNLNKEGNLFP